MSNILQNSINVNDLFEEIEEKEIYGFIYKITNLITDNIYIGQTSKSIKTRWIQHCSHTRKKNTSQYIHRSMRKYGIENFIIEEIDRAYSLDELNQKEYDWIIKENCLAPNGYNMKDGGEHNIWREETKQIMKEKMIGKYLNDKWIYNPKTLESKRIKNVDKIPEGYIYGRPPMRQDQKDQLSKINTGSKSSELTKKLLSKQRIGRRWIHNIETGERKFIHVDVLPDGWSYGSNIINHKTNNGKIWIYNVVTGENEMINKDMPIPYGFIRGKKQKRNYSNKRL